MGLKIYEVNPDYVDYLSEYEPHLIMRNAKQSQSHERKYVGILLHIDDMDYLAPLSSFKPKHAKMKNAVDMFKVGTYGVINLNNMFPVPSGEYWLASVNSNRDPKYSDLMSAEIRIIRDNQSKIMKNARIVYQHKLAKGDSTSLAKRCPDFKKLEDLCKAY